MTKVIIPLVKLLICEHWRRVVLLLSQCPLTWGKAQTPLQHKVYLCLVPTVSKFSTSSNVPRSEEVKRRRRVTSPWGGITQRCEVNLRRSELTGEFNFNEQQCNFTEASICHRMIKCWTHTGFLGALAVLSATELGLSSTEIGLGADVLVPFTPLVGLGDVPRPPNRWWD